MTGRIQDSTCYMGSEKMNIRCIYCDVSQACPNRGHPAKWCWINAINEENAHHEPIGDGQ